MPWRPSNDQRGAEPATDGASGDVGPYIPACDTAGGRGGVPVIGGMGGSPARGSERPSEVPAAVPAADTAPGDVGWLAASSSFDCKPAFACAQEAKGRTRSQI